MTLGDHDHSQHEDLVGGPFAVVESDPGVFTSLTRKLGVRNIELVEMYDIEPWATDHLNPHGLIFCFLWRKDVHRPADFNDPAAERVWFANQLSDDACASHAILNVLLNCPDIDVGDDLRSFRSDTEKMTPVVNPLRPISYPTSIRPASRPADIRGALNAIAITTLEEAKSKAKTTKTASSTKRGTKPPPTKRARKTATEKKSSPSKIQPRAKAKPATEDEEEAYHFIGYVPAYGKVWELDGFKSGPLEVGELPLPASSSSAPSSSSSARNAWMDVVRPALRMKMEKYGGTPEGGNNIRFSLLAIVDGIYEKVSDALQLLRREKAALERRLGEGWEGKVDQELLVASQHAFSAASGEKTYAVDFGSQFMDISLRIQNMPEEDLVPAWEACMRSAVRANVEVEDELSKATRANVCSLSFVVVDMHVNGELDVQTEHMKRTFDYEPFLKAFMGQLQAEGLLNPLMGREEDGSRVTKAKR
ncbi:hypothetical protein C0993_008192 [Termitomyces sp. T159_Od127]|nr:hypothetical protein C0993_008192 [Termitomyces sp. T159_Od127]